MIALVITAGTVVVFGETLTNPTDIVARIDNVTLTVVAAITFFAATVGINTVANFIPPAYDIANPAPPASAPDRWLHHCRHRLFIGALWVAFISEVGIAAFVDTLGAALAPLYGIIVADYYRSGVSVWMYSSCSAPNVPASITSTLAGTARQ